MAAILHLQKLTLHPHCMHMRVWFMFILLLHMSMAMCVSTMWEHVFSPRGSRRVSFCVHMYLALLRLVVGCVISK